jgi:hypothetical protein
MDSKYDFGKLHQDRVVYVRPVTGKDLPLDVRAQVGRRATLYAVHNSEGERLALVEDRNMAFSLARQNDLAPVAVH